MLKRVGFAFGLVMILHAWIGFGPDWFSAFLPAQTVDLIEIFSFLIAPSLIFLVALYRTPILNELKTGPLRLVRVGVLFLSSVVLGYASMFIFLAVWVSICWFFGLPFREA